MHRNFGHFEILSRRAVQSEVVLAQSDGDLLDGVSVEQFELSSAKRIEKGRRTQSQIYPATQWAAVKTCRSVMRTPPPY